MFALSYELSGAIAQVLVQRNELMKHYFSKAKESGVDFEVFAPQCIVIAGMLSKLPKRQVKSFEMQRAAVRPAVQIWTYDELYDRFGSFNLVNHLDDAR